MNKHITAFDAHHKQDGELIIDWVEATRRDESFLGALVLTNRRVAYIRTGILSDKFEPWPLGKVSSVETRRGIVFFEIELHTSGDSLKVRTAEKNKAEEFVKKLQEELNRDGPATPPAQANQEDPIAKLRELGQLRDAGIVTPEEFEAKKAELLARI